MVLSRRTRRRRSVVQPTISLTPLIDTALTLLVVFMVTASVAHRAVRVDLLRATADESLAHTGKKFVITVAADGTVFLDGTARTQVDVVTAVKGATGDGTQLVIVCMHVDRAASCGNALELFFALRAIEGVQSVDFDVERTP